MRSDARGIHFGFNETPAAILDKARALGLPIERLIEEGHIGLIWQPTTEGLLDETPKAFIPLSGGFGRCGWTAGLPDQCRRWRRSPIAD
jgi:hypothetical protein